MTSPATLMEYGWSFLDAGMSNPADYEMMIGSDSVESGLVKDHPESNYRIEHDSFAKVIAMLRGTCTLRSVLATNSDNAAVLDKILMVSLDSTSINPRPIAPSIPDSPQRLNWYIDRVDIELGFPVPPAGLERSADVPNTSSLKGQDQSSISQTLSVGFFGDTATGTYSKTWSHSFAIQLEDFGIERKSVGADVLQTLHLEMSTSAAYAQPSDMIDGPPLWNGTRGSTLRTAPDRNHECRHPHPMHLPDSRFGEGHLPVPDQADAALRVPSHQTARLRRRIARCAEDADADIK